LRVAACRKARAHRCARVALAACVLTGCAAPAQAGDEDLAGPQNWQWAASLGVISDYRFRGVSLSDEHPSLHAAFSLDHASGAYGGLALNTTELEPGERRPQWQAYGGYAVTLAQDLSGELGAVLARISGESAYDYGECYLGLAAQRWSARLYYSPDYLGRGWSSLYGEFGASLPLGERLRVFAHAGALHSLEDNAMGVRPATRYDASIGVALFIETVELRLAWVGTSHGYAVYPQRRNTAVLGATLAF